MLKLAQGVPGGNRTRVTGVRGQRPEPLDDGDKWCTTLAMHLGQRARIKPEGWTRYEQEGNKAVLRKDGEHHVIAAPLFGMHNDLVMLSFPFFWFREDEVEPC